MEPLTLQSLRVLPDNFGSILPLYGFGQVKAHFGGLFLFAIFATNTYCYCKYLYYISTINMETMRTIKTKKRYAGCYDVYDRSGKRLGHVERSEDGERWLAYDENTQPVATGETKAWVLTAFEV